MRKITLLVVIILATFNSTELFAYNGINATTAWWNNQTFESYAAGTDFKAAGATAWSGWTSSYFVLSQSITASTTGTATGNVLGFATSNVTALAEVSQGGTRTFTKSDFNPLTGYVYGKTSFYCATGGNGISTNYSLKNSTGGIVFEFGGVSATSNNLWITGVPAATLTMGARGKWADIEFLLDLNNNKALTAIVTYSGVSKTYTNITLAAGTNINTLLVTEAKGYDAGGFDNTTFAQLVPDSIANMSGSGSVQTLSTNINNDYSVTSLTKSMGQYLTIDKTDLNVVWTISDWGTLSTADQALVSLVRKSSDFRIATLTTGNISADATITLTATYGTITLTKTVALKALTIDGVKATLLSEINKAIAARDAVTDINPFITGTKSALQNLIDAAQTTYNNSSATIADVTAAISNLQTAETTFATTLSPYNDFLTYIGTVQTGYNAETRTATFFTSIKGTLNTALTNAATARTAITSTDDIASAKTALQTSFAQFNTDVPAYANLQTQIATVVSRLAIATPRKGDTQFLMFTTSSVDALTTAKATADAALANSTTATQLTTAQTDLGTALTTFNAASRVSPSNILTYKIYTYGADNGDGGTTKSILYLDAATSTLKYATPDNVNVANTEWTISEVSTGNYTFLNKTLSGVYLNGTTTSTTAMNFTLPEGFSQNNLINASTDTYFIYYLVNPSGKGLEVDVFDATSSTGVFLTSSAPANRFRFAYQFEPVSPTTAATSLKNSTIKLYTINDNLIIDGIKLGEKYTIYNSIGSIVKSDIATSTKVEVKLVRGAYIIKAENDSYKFIK